MIYWFTQSDAKHIRIVKDEGECIMKDTSYGFLSKWCLLHGSTLEGRKKAACFYLSVRQKVPILVSFLSKDIVFPTRAMHHEQCHWINYRSILDTKRKGNKTEIVFLDGSLLLLDLEYRSIKRSMQLCKTYLECLSSLR